MRPTPTVVLRTQFVGAAGELLALLQSRVAWDERLRARKTASFVHSDDTDELADGTGVAIISLGAERSIVFRNKQDRLNEVSYGLPSGSLLYMPRELQFEWLHAIPTVPDAGPRTSLTFRLLVKAGR